MGTSHLRRPLAGLLATALTTVALAACSDADGDPAPGAQAAETWEAAASTPQRDSIYRSYGNPAIDVRHYGLDLTWDGRTLTGEETVSFRALADAGEVVLDLGAPLAVERAEVDGRAVESTRAGDTIRLAAEVTSGSDHTLTLTYTGTPAGVKAPSQRGSLGLLGWNASETGEVTTIQQPYGAFTWYAVNDHPSDKAFHDVTLRVPAKWVGISNGTLEGRDTTDGQTVTVWHGSAPAAPSAMTVAIGDYAPVEATTAGGTPVTTWTRPDDTISQEALTRLPALVDWLEERLGDYPFEAVGAVVVDGTAGADTQETITVGRTPSTRTEVALVNQLAHQWWGNAVTPADWSALWIAEGVPFLLAEGDWRVEHDAVPWSDVVAGWRTGDRLNRRVSGPPTGWKRGNFGPASVDYGSALMWQGLRASLGEDDFAKVLSELPQEFGGRSVTRVELLTWLKASFGVDLTASAAAWLDGEQTPATGSTGN